MKLQEERMSDQTRLPKNSSRSDYISSIRLHFSYKGYAVRLLSRQKVEMIPPPSDQLEPQEGQSGFWYEVRDAANRTLYRRITHNPIKVATEVRSDDPARPLAWQQMSDPQGEFFLLIPELEKGQTLVLFSSPLIPREAADPAMEIARFDLAPSAGGRVVV
jgi:hypothetical protein